ncbi:uncharacterized protein [Spinacia oleracea]|uniref:DUF4283 domain-containing protein n=1 Tax=Spinacia oleracea TaxID=3562 RepID=A0A9R0JLJ4_SPIOL|nr:uncharacterized protein LOC110778495 [Spinacia oleracea]
MVQGVTQTPPPGYRPLASLQALTSTTPPPNYDPSMEAFISLDKEEAMVLSEQWINSLIIKVIGKSFSVDYLKTTLQRIWKTNHQIRFIALGKGFYNISVPNEEVREHILSQGSWFIASYMLIVQPWMPGFIPSQAIISKAPVWVSLPELPIEFHSLQMFQRIASEIGTFIKTDTKALEQNRVRFARIQVLLDLAKQRKEVIWLGAFKQSIYYEEIPHYCNQCQSIGHRSERCTHYPVDKGETEDDAEEVEKDKNEGVGQNVAPSQATNEERENTNP